MEVIVLFSSLSPMLENFHNKMLFKNHETKKSKKKTKQERNPLYTSSESCLAVPTVSLLCPVHSFWSTTADNSGSDQNGNRRRLTETRSRYKGCPGSSPLSHTSTSDDSQVGGPGTTVWRIHERHHLCGLTFHFQLGSLLFFWFFLFLFLFSDQCFIVNAITFSLLFQTEKSLEYII